MRSRARHSALLGVALLAASALTACSLKANKTLTYGEAADFPDNWLPINAAAQTQPVADILGRVMDGAFRIEPDMTYQADPDQITSAESSMADGQQTVDIKINANAVWDDGTPITSADYLFTLQVQKSQDPAKGGCAALQNVAGFSQIASYRSISDKEFAFTFIKGQAFADWRSLFAGASGGAPILSKHVFDQGSAKDTCAYISKGWAAADGVPSGASNGPWLLTRKNINVGQKSASVVPNPRYWGIRPKLDRINFVVLGTDSATTAAAIQNQVVDMVYPPARLDLLNKLRKARDVATITGYGPSFSHLDFNTRDPLLGNKTIRQAIAYAIDRPALISAVVAPFTPEPTLGNHILMTNQPGYQDNGGAYAKPNIAKATQLLAGLGATKGSDGIYTLKGRRLSFTLLTEKDRPLAIAAAQLVAQQVRQIGVDITQKQSDDLFANAKATDSLAAGKFQLALYSWTMSPALSAANSIYQSPAVQAGQGDNFTFGGTPEIDQTLTEMSQAPTPKDQVELVNKADVLLWNEMDTLPLFQDPTVLSYSTAFAGIADNPTQAGPMWNSDTFVKK